MRSSQGSGKAGGGGACYRWGAGSPGEERNSKGGAKSLVRCWPEDWLARNRDRPWACGDLDTENLRGMFLEIQVRSRSACVDNLFQKFR